MLYKWWVLLVLLALPAVALAQNSPQLHWEQYDNLADIQPDGSVQVQEQQVLVVDRGPLNGMTRSFETGQYGQIANIRVLEDGQPYQRREGRDPGTYSGSDNGQEASIRVNFRDPNASRHSFTIQYTIRGTLTNDTDRAGFAWNFFWSQQSAPPRINSGSVVVRFPGTVSASQLRAETRGASVRQSSTSNSVRWELTQPIQGQQLGVAAVFPRALLAQTAQFRSSNSAPVPNRNVPQPAQGMPPVVATGSGIGSFMFCMIALLFVFIAFSMMRSSMRSRRAHGNPSTPTSYGPGPFDMPHNRRGWRGRRYGGWGGGFGFPPIIIVPPTQPHDNTPFDNNNTPFDSGSGGGSSSWGDSGGGSSSWGDSGGGSSSWGDSGGGSSSWGDSGGGSSSWGDSGGSWGGGGDSGGGGGGGSFD